MKTSNMKGQLLLFQQIWTEVFLKHNYKLLYCVTIFFNDLYFCLQVRDDFSQFLCSTISLGFGTQTAFSPSFLATC